MIRDALEPVWRPDDLTARLQHFEQGLLAPKRTCQDGPAQATIAIFDPEAFPRPVVAHICKSF
jgi:hypothetical protein